MKLILELILTVSIFILKQKNMVKVHNIPTAQKCVLDKNFKSKWRLSWGKKKELLTTMRKIKVIKRVT